MDYKRDDEEIPRDLTRASAARGHAIVGRGGDHGDEDTPRGREERPAGHRSGRMGSPPVPSPTRDDGE